MVVEDLGIALFLAFFWLLALGRDTVLISVAIFAGIVADLEGLAISLALREPRTDVPSLLHAIRSRSAAGPGGGRPGPELSLSNLAPARGHW